MKKSILVLAAFLVASAAYAIAENTELLAATQELDPQPRVDNTRIDPVPEKPACSESEYKNKLAEIMARVDVVAIAEFTGETQEIQLLPESESGTPDRLYNSLFKLVEPIKGNPKAAINILEHFDSSQQYVEGQKYLLLLRYDKGLPKMIGEGEHKIKDWYGSAYGLMSIPLN